MSISKVKAIAVVLTMAAAVFAQENARMRSMGFAPMSDISDVFTYPVLMMGYPNQVQATFNDGAVIGIKQIGEGFSIGVLANQGLMCPGFADAAITHLNALPGGPVGGRQFNENFNIPHLLLGFGAGPLNLGLDIFVEYASYNANTVDLAGNDNISKAHILNPGARVSAGLEFGDMELLAKFGMGFPSYGGEYRLGATTTKIDPNSKGLYMETGAELSLPIADLDFTAGFGYGFENFNTHNNSTGPHEWHSIITVYLGAEFNVLETAAAALGYTFFRFAETDIMDFPSGNPVSTTKAMDGIHAHVFNLGMENIWDNAWIFDAFALRAGALYALGLPVVRNTSDGDLRSKIKFPGTHSGVNPTMGFGVSYSFLTLDLALDMGDWSSGVFAGPAAGLVTGTIKF
ncbi:MAG: hypothetical protein FWE57_09275 [Chitinispirillia bacterium]|nr:hypothetical protein [Chitinispirillia bacterium]